MFFFYKTTEVLNRLSDLACDGLYEKDALIFYFLLDLSLIKILLW